MNKPADTEGSYGFINITKTNKSGFNLIYKTNTTIEGKDLRNTITLHCGKYFTVQISLPAFIKPAEVKNDLVVLDKKLMEQMGKKYFYDYFPRWYGVSILGSYLQLYYGRQKNTQVDTKERRKFFFLPWMEYRLFSHLILNPQGEVFWDNKTYMLEGSTSWRDRPVGYVKARIECPKHKFVVEDANGEIMHAYTHVEKRIWKKGINGFTWVSLISKNVTKSTLEIGFVKNIQGNLKEVQKYFIRTSIPMYDTETQEDAFRRFCSVKHAVHSDKYRFRFIKLVAADVKVKYFEP